MLTDRNELNKRFLNECVKTLNIVQLKEQDQEFCVGILSLERDEKVRLHLEMFIFEIQRESEMNNVERENRFSSYYH